MLIKTIFADLKMADSSASSNHFIQNFKPLTCLGRGSFGTVYKCKNLVDNLEYAVKQIRLPSTSQKEERQGNLFTVVGKINKRECGAKWMRQKVV